MGSQRPQRLGRTALTIESLEEILGRHGYVRCFFLRKATEETYLLGKIGFVRPSGPRGGFEQIFLQIVEADVVVILRLSIVPTANQWAGMFTDKVLRIFEQDKAYCRVRTAADRVRWLDEILAVAPEHNRLMAESELPGLLESTAHARSAAEFYLSKLPRRVEDLESFWSAQKREATDDDREAARRMLRSGLLDMPFNTQDEEDRAFWAYQIAGYAIVLNEAEAVPHGYFERTCDPYKCDDLAWCFQVMASRIYGHPLWDVVLSQEASTSKG